MASEIYLILMITKDKGIGFGKDYFDKHIRHKHFKFNIFHFLALKFIIL